MNFDCDAYLSYADLDNVALKQGSEGWVSNFHRALEVRIGQLLGKQAKICRDTKPAAGEALTDMLAKRLRRVATLVPVVSPAYVKSELSRRELSEFRRAAEEQGGVRFHDRYRIFKVLKTPVPPEKQISDLQDLLGYEFFKVDSETGRVRELNEIFGPAAQADFWIRLDDLAHDICNLLESLEGSNDSDSTVHDQQKKGVFLAETTADLKEQRNTIKRDLLQRGIAVFPTRELSTVASELKASLRDDLTRCWMSIHLIGKSYGLVPEGGFQSLLEVQNELAIARSEEGRFSRLLWIPAGLGVEDERQQKVIQQLRMDSRIHAGTDLLETRLEDLRTVIQDRLKQTQESPRSAADEEKTGRDLTRVYFICDQRDADAIAPWVDFLFERKVEVIRPMFDGEEADLREYHEESLRTCDGVLIFYGSANECWLLRKLREVQKSAGYGRTKPAPIVAIALVPPTTPAKERFRTHEAIVIPQWDGITGDALRPFLSRCQQRHSASVDYSHEPQDASLMASTASDIGVLKIGTRLGRYEILAPLGEGGMGKVYRARDSRLDRDVAIKVLSAGLLADEVARRRFYKEALALAHFNHPHIAVIHDVGEVAGVDYLVMECVNGESLRDKLKNGALMEEEILLLGGQIAEALEEAHDQGIIHRDLKPGNVMVTAKQQVKVLDFGLAKLRATTESFPETRSIAGTIPYMAPEQFGGEPVDARADIYALGTVLFEMAVGRRLFPEDSMIRLFDAILNRRPVLARTINPAVSEELERIIDKAVQKNRDLRYQTAADLRAALTKLRDAI